MYPVARHKEKEDEVKNGEAEEDTTNEIVCPNCRQSVPEGSRFCNHCGQNIGGYKKSPKPEKRKG
ncbi:MAG: zinc-ribbon domain-containing protein [Candidatus Bathyarchaeia archaeon]